MKFHQTRVISSGKPEGALLGLQQNRSSEVHEVILEITERLFRTFSLRKRLWRLSNELQEATIEDPNHISFESIKLIKDLHAEFETYKQRVWCKNKCSFFIGRKFFHCKIYFLLRKNFSKNFVSDRFEDNMNTKISNYVGNLCCLFFLWKNCA